MHVPLGQEWHPPCRLGVVYFKEHYSRDTCNQCMLLTDEGESALSIPEWLKGHLMMVVDGDGDTRHAVIMVKQKHG